MSYGHAHELARITRSSPLAAIRAVETQLNLSAEERLKWASLDFKVPGQRMWVFPLPKHRADDMRGAS